MIYNNFLISKIENECLFNCCVCYANNSQLWHFVKHNSGLTNTDLTRKNSSININCVGTTYNGLLIIYNSFVALGNGLVL